MEGHPRHEERDTGVAFSCLGCGKHPRHEERDHVVAFFMFGWKGGNEAIEHEKHAIRRMFFVFWWKGSCRYGKISE